MSVNPYLQFDNDPLKTAQTESILCLAGHGVPQKILLLNFIYKSYLMTNKSL